MKLRALPLVVLPAALLSACVTLEPYDRVAARLPASKLIELERSASGAPVSQRIFVEQAGQQGEPVLLLHGFGGSSYSWRLVQPALAERYRTFAPDLSGFGFTERSQERDHYSRSGQLELVLELMRHFDLEKAHVIGHSYGGALALAFAYEFPERVASLTLLDPAHPDYTRQRRKRLAASRAATGLVLRGYGLRRSRIRSALERSFHDDDLVTDELVDEYRRRLLVEGATTAYHGLTAPTSEPEPPVELSEIRQPTLVLWGREDELIPVDEARDEVAKMPDARFEVLEETGHIPMEESPEEVSRLVRSFLDGLPQAVYSSR